MKISRIKLITAGVLLLLAIAGIHYVLKSLPQSKVSLVFKGVSKVGTNSIAAFDLVNAGPRTIYCDRGEALIQETESGWVTNTLHQFTTVILGTAPGSNETVLAEVPVESRRWMYRVDYSSFRKYNVRLETTRILVNAHAEKYLPNFMGKVISVILSLFPDPREEDYELYSEIFTKEAVEKSIASTNLKP